MKISFSQNISNGTPPPVTRRVKKRARRKVLNFPHEKILWRENADTASPRIKP